MYRPFFVRSARRIASRLVLAVAVLALPLGFAACSGSSPTEPAMAAGGHNPIAVASDSIRLANLERTDRGLPPLRVDPALSDVALSHSDSMSSLRQLGHGDPGGSLEVRLRRAGVSFRIAGENVGTVARSGNPAGEIHGSFMASPSHRANILDPRFDTVGVGVVVAGDTWWLTQVFAGER